MSARLQFDDMMIAEDGGYALGIERSSGRHYISVDVSGDGADRVEAHFALSEEEFMALLDDCEGGAALARRCRAGEEDGRLIAHTEEG